MPNSPSNFLPPTAQQVESIIALEDAVLRNLKITLTYHRLAVALTNVLGAKNVSWCAYAVWASKTAGSYIRKEGIHPIIRKYFGEADYVTEALSQLNGLVRKFRKDLRIEQTVIKEVLDNVTDEVARNVAEGNLKVFEELAPYFLQMIELFSKSTSYDQTVLDNLLVSPRTVPFSDEDHERLLKAYEQYYRAVFTQDQKVKAEQILMANLLVGYHEQIRLQGSIEGAMEAPLDGIVEKVLKDKVHGALRAKAPWIYWMLIKLIVRERLNSLAKKLAGEWRNITTRWMMTLELPDECLELEKDVPSLKASDMFPPELKVVGNSELLSLIKQLDRNPDSFAGSGARDWGTLDDRMNFIVDLFRSRQQSAILYHPPFSDHQVDEIDSGEIPSGSL